MANPKRRTSKMKQRTRRGASRWTPQALRPCPECRILGKSHTVCPACGYYKGKQIINVKVKEVANEN